MTKNFALLEILEKKLLFRRSPSVLHVLNRHGVSIFLERSRAPCPVKASCHLDHMKNWAYVNVLTLRFLLLAIFRSVSYLQRLNFMFFLQIFTNVCHETFLHGFQAESNLRLCLSIKSITKSTSFVAFNFHLTWTVFKTLSWE